MSSLQNLFKETMNKKNADDEDIEEDESENDTSRFSMPKPEDIHSHIQDMFDGKIGNLAKEIADETMKDMDIDMNNPENATSMFKNLLKDPKKLMGLVQSVGKKLDEKLKSGEVKETELLKEASEMLKKMKDMPGMNHMESMFKNMGIPMPSGAGGRGSKMNFGAMQGRLNQQMKQAQMKERMRERMEKQKNQVKSQQQDNITQSDINQEVDTLMNTVFSTGESVERSMKSQKPNKPKKKKKGKKNK